MRVLIADSSGQIVTRLACCVLHDRHAMYGGGKRPIIWGASIPGLAVEWWRWSQGREVVE